jgi:hypothetical protein
MWLELALRRHGNIQPAKVDIALTPALGLVYLAWSTLVMYMSEGKVCLFSIFPKVKSLAHATYTQIF